MHIFQEKLINPVMQMANDFEPEHNKKKISCFFKSFTWLKKNYDFNSIIEEKKGALIAKDYYKYRYL